MQEISILIDQNGVATVSVGCVKGKSCVDLTRDIEKALGRTIEDTKTKAYHEKGEVHVQDHH